MVLCLTEKSSQVEAFKSAGFMEFSFFDGLNMGTYNNEEYLFVPLSGHILKIDDDEVINNIIDVNNFIPLNEFYPLVKSEEKKAKKPHSNLSKITKTYLNQIDRVLIMTDPDREGALIGKETLEYYNILDNVNDITYVDMNNTNPSALKKAFDYAIDTGKDCMDWQDMAFVGEIVRNLNFTGRITSFAINNYFSSKHNTFAGMSVGTQQLRALHLLVERYKANKNADTRNHYRIKLHTSNGVFLVELDGEDTSDKNKIQQIGNSFLGNNISITDVSNKLLAKKSPTWYDGSQLGAEISKITQKSIKEIFSNENSLLQTMYEKGILTYIRGEAKGKMPTENFDDYVKIAKSLAPQYGIQINTELQKAYLWRKPNSKVKVNHTPTTLATQIDMSKYSGIEKVALDLVSKQILATFMDELVNRVVSVSGGIAGYKAVQKDSKIHSLGWGVVYGKSQKDFVNKNIEKIKEQDVLSVKEVELEEYKKPKPALYTEATFIEDLKRKKIGNESTYGSYVDILTDKKKGYGVLEKGKIIPTKKGIALDEVITVEIRDVLKYFEELSSDFIEGKVSKNELFDMTRKISYKFYTDILKVIDENHQKLMNTFKNNSKNSKNSSSFFTQIDYKCPKCGEPIIKSEEKKIFKCSKNKSQTPECSFVIFGRSIKFNIYTLSDSEIEELLTYGTVKKEVYNVKSSLKIVKTIKLKEDKSGIEVV